MHGAEFYFIFKYGCQYLFACGSEVEHMSLCLAYSMLVICILYGMKTNMFSCNRYILKKETCITVSARHLLKCDSTKSYAPFAIAASRSSFSPLFGYQNMF